MTGPERPDAEAAEAIESPCIDICVIDEESGRCEGCGRTLEQIAGWSSYTAAERRRILDGLARLAPRSGD